VCGGGGNAGYAAAAGGPPKEHPRREQRWGVDGGGPFKGLADSQDAASPRHHRNRPQRTL